MDRADAGFLIEFALWGRPSIFAGIDAALRHLPNVRLVDVFDASGAATDEDKPGCVDQHHADACSIGQVFVTRHLVKPLAVVRDRRVRSRAAPELPQPDFDFSIAVVNGTSMMPWLSSALIQTPIRSIEIGNAEAMPTAIPRSFARVSSLARARSISADVGTASIERSALAKGIAWPAASVGATLRGADPSSR